jgi:hypothetical protein
MTCHKEPGGSPHTHRTVKQRRESEISQRRVRERAGARSGGEKPIRRREQHAEQGASGTTRPRHTREEEHQKQREGEQPQSGTQAHNRVAAKQTLGEGSTGRPPERRRRRRASGAGWRHGCREGGQGGSGQPAPEGRDLGRGLAKPAAPWGGAAPPGGGRAPGPPGVSEPTGDVRALPSTANQQPATARTA